MKKKALYIVVGIVLILAIAVWQLLANLDSIVAGVIEDVGTETLQTEVSVSGVSIDLKGGKAGIAGMTIANPEGYSSANLFAMEGIEVDLDLASLGKDVLIINSVRIDNPHVVFEGDKSGGSNMQKLLDNIKSGSSGSSQEQGGESARMIIKRFEFSGGQVKGSSELKPDQALDFKLPAITMSGIGQAEGGVTADVVAQEIGTELVNAVIKAAAREGINNVIEKKTKGLLDKIKGKG